MDLSISRKEQSQSVNRIKEPDTMPARQLESEKHQRLTWLDIAKGIGILAVICGHNMPDAILHVKANRYWYDFIYWWHMPLFFVIGGFFLKPINLLDIRKLGAFFRKRITPLLSSYLIAGVLLITVYMLVHKTSLTYSLTYLLKLIYGGKTLSDYTTVFWYPETYLLGIIGTTVIISIIRIRPLQLLIAGGFIYWSTSYGQQTYFKAFGIVTAPWDMDVAVLVMAYMLIGYNLFYFGKSRLTKWYVTLPAFITVGGLFFLLKNQQLSFGLFMRSHQLSGSFGHLAASHSELVLMVGIIPILCCAAVFGVSQLLSYSLNLSKNALLPGRFMAQTLTLLGHHTLIIMYMHKMVLDILDVNHVTSSYWLQVLTAATIPLLIGVTFQHLAWSQRRKMAYQ